MPPKSKVYFFFETSSFSLTNRGDLKKFIEQLFSKEKQGLDSLNYIFCSDKRLLQINQEYLKHDYYTDIITFDLSNSSTGNTTGEIYISVDRVKDNANRNGVSFKEELHRMVFHGALHLCGYKDKKPADKKLMTQKENEYLAKYGF
jgi:rRNA maturation RNase YbeY